MKKRIGVIALALLLGNTLTGCADNVQAKEKLAAETAESEQESEISAWGEVKAYEEYQINIDFPAMVKSITVKEGDWVEKDELLAELDMTEFNNHLITLENSIRAGEEVLDKIQQDTAGIEAQLEQAQRNIADAQRYVSNYQILFNSGGVSEEELNHYKLVLDQQRTEQQVLKVQLDEIKKANTSNVTRQTNEIATMEKELETYQNKKTKPYLNNELLLCPFEHAVVKTVSAKQGSLLGEGGTTVMELVDLDTTYVSAEIDEEFVKYLSKDLKVRIVPTGNTELSLSGTIASIPAIAVEKNGNRIVRVQVAVEDPEYLLLPGYTVDVYLPVSSAE